MTRRRRRIIVVLVVLLMLAGGAVFFAPAILSSSFGRNLIAGAIEPSVNGQVTIGELDISWGGPQQVRGLTVQSADGETTADLDITVTGGLLDLAGGPERIAVSVSGELSTRIGADGAVAAATLIADTDTPAPATSATSPMPAIELDLSGLKVELTIDDGKSDPLILEKLVGPVIIDGDDITAKLNSPVRRGAECGTFSLELERGANTIDTTIELVNMPLPFADQPSRVDHADLHLVSHDLTKQARLTIAARAALDGGNASELNADLVLAAPLAADGTIELQLDRIAGELHGGALPTSLLSPLLEGTAFDVNRDLGEQADLELKFGRGTERTITGSIDTSRIQVVFAGSAAVTGALTIDTLDATVAVDPALAQDLLGTTAANDLALVARAGPLVLPDVTDLSLETLTDLALDADVRLDGAQSLPLEDGGAIDVSHVQLTLAGGGSAPHRIDITVTGPQSTLRAEAHARFTGQRIEVERFTSNVTAAPEALQQWLAFTPDDPSIKNEVTVQLDLLPFALVAGDDAAWQLAAPIQANGQLGDLTLEIPGLEKSLTVQGATVTALRQVTGATTLNAAAQLHRGSHSIGLLAFAAEVNGAGETSAAHLTITDLDVRSVERLTGLPAHQAESWLGDRGQIEVDLAGADDDAWHATFDFPEAEGVIVVALDDQLVRVVHADLTARLSAKQLNEFVIAEDEAATLKMTAALPVRVTLDNVQIPLEALQGGMIDPALCRGDVMMAGGPVSLMTAEGLPVALDEIKLVASLDELASGVPFRLNADIPPDFDREDSEPGTAVFDGTLVQLFDDDGALATDHAQLTGQAEFTGLPTAMIDGFGDLDGQIESAIGSTVDGTARFNKLSRTTGSIDIDLRSPLARLTGRIRGYADSWRTVKSEDHQLNGALTLTETSGASLLRALNPVFAEIVSTERPIEFRMTSATRLPHSHDPAELRGDIHLDVGPVAFKPSTDLFNILLLFGEQRDVVPGRIDPVDFKIRKGIVTCDSLRIWMDQYEIVMTGTVDLVREQVDLRWTMPLGGLAHTFNELEGYENLPVPLMTTGPLDNPKTEIAPEFADTAAKMIGDQLLKRGLDELFKKIGGGGA